MIISEEKILFLTQLIFTTKKEIFELESSLNSGDEKEVTKIKDNLKKLCEEVEHTLNSIQKLGGNPNE